MLHLPDYLMKMRQFLFFLIFFSIFFCAAKGQNSEDTTQCSGNLALRIKSISFIKDNEYPSYFIEGYTLTGYIFQPELVYSPSSNLILNGGIHMLNFSGTGKIYKIRPVFATSLFLSDELKLTIGTLYGSDSHKLFDPHFNTERIYTNYNEEGFQLTKTGKNLFSDTWLSWENYIFKGDTTREIFVFGESLRYKLPKMADILRIEVPVQILFKHFGGEISNYREPVETLFNMAAGLEMDFDISGGKAGEAGIEYLRFINKQLNGKSPTGIENGNATWIRGHYTFKSIYAGAAYWKSHNFYSPSGNTIFSSVSDYRKNLIVHDRQILSGFVYYRPFYMSFVEFLFGGDAYYDLFHRRFDYALTLHLNFDKLIRLTSVKDRK
jgi:hypothetical protein